MGVSLAVAYEPGSATFDARIADTVVMYDNTSGVAFGPVFDDTDIDEVTRFFDSLYLDPRQYGNDLMLELWMQWKEAQ